MAPHTETKDLSSQHATSQAQESGNGTLQPTHTIIKSICHAPRTSRNLGNQALGLHRPYLPMRQLDSSLHSQYVIPSTQALYSAYINAMCRVAYPPM